MSDLFKHLTCYVVRHKVSGEYVGSAEVGSRNICDAQFYESRNVAFSVRNDHCEMEYSSLLEEFGETSEEAMSLVPDGWDWEKNPEIPTSKLLGPWEVLRVNMIVGPDKG